MSSSEFDESLFVKTMREIAEKLAISPREVKRDTLLAEAPGVFTTRQLHKFGGFGALRERFFPEELGDRDRVYTSGTRMIRAYRNKLDRQYGDSLYIKAELLETVREVLSAYPPPLHPPSALVGTPAKIQRTLVACISDTHFGSNINKAEMGGINEYNWEIAARRLAYFVSQIATYKLDHRGETELVIQLNGDILAGVIHNQEHYCDLMTDQFVGTMHLLGQAISYLASRFGSIRVVCTPGNHGRMMHKADKGRASTHKWDSFESMLYHALSLQIGSLHRNVEFIIPQSPYALYDIGGKWLVLQTHGDTGLNVGNPGSAIAVKSIRDQINTINSSDAMPAGRRLKVVCVGHLHTATVQLTDEGSMLIINGCLSGADPFAGSIGIMSSNPTQILFEATSAHPVGDIRIVQVKRADKMEKLDSIIRPYLRILDI